MRSCSVVAPGVNPTFLAPCCWSNKLRGALVVAGGMSSGVVFGGRGLGTREGRRLRDLLTWKLMVYGKNLYHQ